MKASSDSDIVSTGQCGVGGGERRIGVASSDDHCIHSAGSVDWRGWVDCVAYCFLVSHPREEGMRCKYQCSKHAHLRH